MVDEEPEMIPLFEVTTTPVWVFASSGGGFIVIVFLVSVSVCCWRKQNGRLNCIELMCLNRLFGSSVRI